MKLILINEFYPPDRAPTGRYLDDLARYLVARGHDVSVLTSQAAYQGGARYPSREMIAGVRVRRSTAVRLPLPSRLLRLVNEALFAGSVFRSCCRLPDGTAIVSLTSPPFIGAIVAMATIGRDIRRIPWIMDLYPDAIEVHTRRRFPGLLAMARRELGRAHAVIALGSAMARRAKRYRHRNPEPAAIPLWVPDVIAAPPDAVRHKRMAYGCADDRALFMYSGNMGLGHTFDDVLTSIATSPSTGPLWVFSGDGRRRVEIAAFAAANPEAPLRLVPYAPHTELAAHLGAADVHLVTMRPNWDGIMVPSKAQGIFAIGRPILFIGSQRNEVAQWIGESGGGWAVAVGDIAGLRQAIAQAQDPVERARRGEAARQFAQQRFSRERNLEEIESIVTGRGGQCRSLTKSP